MRNVLTRLRRWLIKRLGGYTEQFTPVHQETIRGTIVPVQKLQAQIAVCRPMRSGAIDFEKFCKDRVLEAIVCELHKSECVRWECETGPLAVTLRATMYVANAEEMRPTYNSWVEESCEH